MQKLFSKNKYRRLAVALTVLFSLLFASDIQADTILFADGSFLSCKVHDKPIVFLHKDPDFVEIEIGAGVLGFYKSGRIKEIRKDDLYKPGDKSISITEALAKLGPGATRELASQRSNQEGPVGRDLDARVLGTKGWAFNRAALGKSDPLKEGQVLAAGSVLGVPNNGRVKIGVRDTEADNDYLLTAGLLSGVTADLGQFRFDEKLKGNSIPFTIRAGKVWFETTDPRKDGRPTEILTASLRVRAVTSTFYIHTLPDGLTRLAVCKGAPLEILWNDQPKSFHLESGRFITFPSATSEKPEDGKISGEEITEWTSWDSWEPRKIAVPLALVIPDMLSFPQEDPETVALRADEAWRALRSGERPKTESLAQKIQRIREALDAYKKDVGQLPTAEQGLSALIQNDGAANWKGPYFPEKEPLDDFWGKPLVYQIWTDPQSGPIADVRSMGPNCVDDMGLGDDIR